MALLLLLIRRSFFAPRSGEHLRRFFIPVVHADEGRVHYKVVVTSGDPAVKRGDPVTLTAYVEATKPDAELPTAATLIVTANGKEERLAMTADEANVWFARRPAAEGDFDYRIEAGGAVSETHHVTVVEPITLASARVTVKPPAYAAHGPRAGPASRGARRTDGPRAQHDHVRPAVRPAADDGRSWSSLRKANEDSQAGQGAGLPADGRPTTARCTVTVPATTSGTFALTADGAPRGAERVPAAAAARPPGRGAEAAARHRPGGQAAAGSADREDRGRVCAPPTTWR